MVNSSTSMEQGGACLPAPISLKDFDQTMVTIRTSLFGEREFNAIKNYLLSENGSIPDRKSISDLFNLSRDLVQRIAYDLRKVQGELARASLDLMEKNEQIESLKEELRQLREGKNTVTQEETSDGGQIREMGMDSVDLAKALCWRSKENGHVLYRNQMQTMLYIMYGKCLARQGSRMTREHPQAWEYGPVFPRVYSKVKSTDDDSFREQSENLRALNPDMSALMDETVSRCSWRGSKELLAAIMATGTPCESSRKRNPDRKTAPMEDAEIQKWFSSRA